jgi:hypothetical protein
MGALAATGCAGWMHPVGPAARDVCDRCAAIPQTCRNHVYIFLIDGEDPLDLANLNGVRDQLISRGYIKTYLGEYHHIGYFKDEILRIHREDETARFVVMGFSLGANAARDVAEAVAPDGVPIDLLVYCGGVALSNQPKGQPANALRVVHVLGRGADSVAAALDGVDTVQLSDVYHFGSPTHSYTTELLDRELAESASRVPVVDWRAADVEPSRAAAVRDGMPPDEWDFLRPARPGARDTAPEMPNAP